MIDVTRARALTPGAEHQAYFYSCGAGLMPRPVLDAVHGHLDLEARIGGYAAEEQAAPATEAAYDAIACLINCHRDEVAIVENATVAWCQAFYGLAQDFKPGDRVLTVVAEYASNFIALLQTVRRRGIVVDVIPNDGDGQADLEALEALIDDDVKLIAVTHVPTSGGLVSPAAQIGAIARRHGIPYLLDACQSAGQLPLDVAELGCDFLSATGRKFLRGPRGTGFLYAGKAIMQRCEPPVLDLHSAVWTAPDTYEMRPDARRYENWENNVAGKIGLGVAVEHALSWGLENIAARNAELSGDLLSRLGAIPGVTLRDAGRRQCAIVTFSHDRLAPQEIAAALAGQAIAIGTSSRSSTLIDFQARNLPPLCRAAVHYHNTEEEVAWLAAAVAAL
ncbi:MAG: aminotransferase class V-fold PLP-dependent enzyme [Proteobacteria bacterium]|nr:aminotransferase class V-fold PLP-dependent enzyme [Pseudomonadota bacterium]